MVNKLIAFQYISCCSLSQTYLRIALCFRRFNTSHVVVYLFYGHYFRKCINRFNTSHVVVYPISVSPRQRRNRCFNTSHVVVYPERTKGKMAYIGFNTSHVVVYPCNNLLITAHVRCFNTSHVVVYPSCPTLILFVYTRFNTSHVVVYRESLDSTNQKKVAFQYISCCSLSVN